MEAQQTRFDSLMQVNSVSDRTSDAALDLIGQLIDTAGDLQRPDGLEKALTLLAECAALPLSRGQQSILHYFWASVYTNWIEIAWPSADERWLEQQWEQEIIHLRTALQCEGFSELPVDRVAQIYTNLANAFSHVGRKIEAIEYWDLALSSIPEFGMAQGNRGLGIAYYAQVTHSGHDALRLFQIATTDLEQGLQSPHVDPEVQQTFQATLDWVQAILRQDPLDRHVIEHRAGYGATVAEQAYRQWCVRHRLVLNFLNDVQLDVDAAYDNLLLPTMTLSIDKGPGYHGLFNQLKQEYVAARFMLYQGMTANEVHYADLGVDLYNTLDYPSYGLAVEHAKIAFRLSYSLFDKIAFFLNKYFQLGIDDRDVNFRSCWYIGQAKKVNQGQSRERRPQLGLSDNWPLSGLLWLSKDLAPNSAEFREVLQPDAKELAHIRNHLEHKYLKVHEFGMPQELLRKSASYDDLAHSIIHSELLAKALRLLKLARAALIYLTLAVGLEEWKREANREPGIVGSLDMPLFDDD